MKKVVIFDTAIATSNLGDEIILDSLKKELAFLLDDSFVMRFGSHVKNFGVKHSLVGDRKTDFSYEADYKLILGTNLLSRDLRRSQGQWPIDNLNSWLYWGSILAGVGTTYSEGRITAYSKKIYRRILRRDFAHSVRDDESKRFLESLGFQAINTGCPTLWGITPELCQKIPSKKAKRCVLSLSGFTDQLDREHDQMLLDILRQNYEELYFWCQTSLDESYLDTFDGVEEIPRIYSLTKYEELLREGDIDYVGTRLHGGIYAIQHEVRTIVIAIDHRARGFNATNNVPICERQDIPTRLADMIQGEWQTEIIVDRTAIDSWKSQFFTDNTAPIDSARMGNPLMKATRKARIAYRRFRSEKDKENK